MREATQQEIEQLGNWFKGFEIAKWLSDVSGIKPVTSFTIDGGFEYNDEGGDGFWPNKVVINGEVQFNEYDDNGNHWEDVLYEKGIRYGDPEYRAIDDTYRKYRIDSPDYGYEPSVEYLLLKTINGSYSWDQNNAPVKLMVIE